MVRELLARRLVRLGRCQDARPYFLPENQAILDDYISSIRDGYDAHRTADDRAGSLFDAARTARDHGMELMGTELGPDWASYGGDFERDDPAERTPAMLSISADEARRIPRQPRRSIGDITTVTSPRILRGRPHNFCRTIPTNWLRFAARQAVGSKRTILSQPIGFIRRWCSAALQHAWGKRP